MVTQIWLNGEVYFCNADDFIRLNEQKFTNKYPKTLRLSVSVFVRIHIKNRSCTILILSIDGWIQILNISTEQCNYIRKRFKTVFT